MTANQGTESLKAFMRAEGVTSTELVRTLGKPASRISEWVNGKVKCTAALILDLWVEGGERRFSFRLPQPGTVAQKLRLASHCTDVQMVVGFGIWGVVRLWEVRNEWLRQP